MLFEISMENKTAGIEGFDISDVKDTEALKKRFLSAMADGWRIRGTSLTIRLLQQLYGGRIQEEIG